MKYVNKYFEYNKKVLGHSDALKLKCRMINI